ncbi:MAG: hypothetical protein BWZ02_00305 [Lentisphaerae bacterium ADurb.BinA184]|nr:MAG: hypothetical protein BWZ02_00305 [Lentisphaerae bacterium ADurb.BinA184]
MKPVAAHGKISATFLDFSERTNHLDKPLDRDLAFWQAELRDMREAGIADVVIARAVVLGRAHYHSALFEEWAETDAVAMVMQAAADQGLGVYLGLDLNMNLWDQSRDFPRMMRRDLRRNQVILDELLPVYRAHPALRGLYLSNEPDRDNVATPERADALRGFLGEMYARIKGVCNLPVFCSPFFSKSLPAPDLAAWWKSFLDRPLFDILAMQDGVGCRYRHIDPEDIPPLYGRLAPIFAERGVRFWNNAETFVFEQFGQPLTPAPLERIGRQYEAGRPFVERTITWEYGHFLGRQQVGEARHCEFRKWNLERTAL